MRGGQHETADGGIGDLASQSGDTFGFVFLNHACKSRGGRKAVPSVATVANFSWRIAGKGCRFAPSWRPRVLLRCYASDRSSASAVLQRGNPSLGCAEPRLACAGDRCVVDLGLAFRHRVFGTVGRHQIL